MVRSGEPKTICAPVNHPSKFQLIGSTVSEELTNKQTNKHMNSLTSYFFRRRIAKSTILKLILVLAHLIWISLGQVLFRSMVVNWKFFQVQNYLDIPLQLLDKPRFKLAQTLPSRTPAEYVLDLQENYVWVILFIYPHTLFMNQMQLSYLPGHGSFCKTLQCFSFWQSDCKFL